MAASHAPGPHTRDLFARETSLSPRLRRRSPPARHWPRLAVVLVCAFALGAPLTAGADSGAQTTLSPGLLDAAQAEPEETFRVIVEGAAGTDAVSEEVRGVASGDEADLRSFLTVPAVAGTLTGSQIVALAQGPEPLVITRDSPVVATDDPRPDEPTAEGTSEEPTVAGDAEPGHLAHRDTGDLERIRRSRLLLPVGALRRRRRAGTSTAGRSRRARQPSRRGMCRDPGGRRAGLSRCCRRPGAEPPRPRDRHGRG